MAKLSSKGQYLLDVFEKELNFVISQNKPMNDQEIHKAQVIIGKKYSMDRITIKEIEKIVKKTYEKHLTMEIYLEISKHFLQTNRYATGAMSIVLLMHATKEHAYKDPIKAKQFLKEIKKWYDEELLDSWPFADSFCIKVIKPLLKEIGKPLEEEIFSWSQEKQNIWLMRASIISFIKYAQTSYNPDFWMTFLASFIPHQDPMIHKGLGWFLKEYFVVYPAEVEEFVRKKYKDMARITIRTAFEKMNKEKRTTILKILK